MQVHFSVLKRNQKFEIKVKIIPERFLPRPSVSRHIPSQFQIIQPHPRNISLFLRDSQHSIVMNNNDCKKLKVIFYKLKKNPKNIYFTSLHLNPQQDLNPKFIIVVGI